MSEQSISLGQAMDQETTSRLAQQIGQGIINQTRIQVELEFAQSQIQRLQAEVARLNPPEPGNDAQAGDLFQGDSK